MKKLLSIIMLMLAVTIAASAGDTKRVLTIRMADGTVRHYDLEAIAAYNFIENPHEYVDLGLPSGNLWATCNIGAESPTDYGWYLSYGEIEEKANYNSAYYGWFNWHRGRMMNTGIIDRQFNSLPDYDSATLLWDDTWHTPTRADWQEMLDECTFTWTTIDGINGDLVTGPNGNSIFLPAGGYYNNGTTISGLGNSCEYRTKEKIYHFNAHNNHRFYDQGYDYFGMSVRPVKTPRPYLYPVEKQLINNDHNSNTVTIIGMNVNSVTASVDITQAQASVSGNKVTVTFLNAPGSDNLTATVTVVVADSKGRTSQLTYEVVQARKAPYNYIDLGLPSGTLWADCDLGADSPEGKGIAVSFGELFPKSDYGANYNLWYYSISATDAMLGGIVDDSYILARKFDAATSWISDDVNTPTREQCLELINNCRWKRTTLNGKAGFDVLGPNGNSIFIPAYGYFRGVNNIEIDKNQHLWTSSRTANSGVCYFRCDYNENGDMIVGENNESYNGLHIRAVTTSAPSIHAIEEQFIPLPEMSASVLITGNNIEYYNADIVGTSKARLSFNGNYLVTTFTEVTDETAQIIIKGYSVNGKCTVAKYNVSLLPEEYQAVDLGLTSGRKWANRNVGAAMPGHSGGYYSYGMTTTLSNYAANNTLFASMQTTGMKYLGAVGATGNLTFKYDAASQNIGSEWRIPTHEEVLELESECEWTIVLANGSRCYKVTGPNGNYILLPLAGYYNNGALTDVGSREEIWTAKAVENATNSFYTNHHIFNKFSTYGGERRFGFNVRAVYDDAPSIMPVREQHVPSSTLHNVVEIEAKNADYITVASSNDAVSVSKSGFTVTTTFPAAGSEERVADITVTAVSPTGETASMTYTVKQLPGLQHEYVDLGLPSGIVWATCNIDAATPYDLGGFYAWGETIERPTYTAAATSFAGPTEDQLIRAGVVEGHLLTEKYDVATDRFGAPWRMSYWEDFKELISTCTWHLETINGVKYRRIVGPNGNSIILPEDGYMRNAGLVYPDWGHYWTKSYTGVFRSNVATIEAVNSTEFFLGMHVRPIRTDAPAITAIGDMVLNESTMSVSVTPTLHNIDPATVTVSSSNPAFSCAFNAADGTLQVTASAGLAHGTSAQITLTGGKSGYNNAVSKFNACYFEANTNNYVDLGLPSGTLWGDCNYNAEYPNSAGDYIGYGDPGPLSTTAFYSPFRGMFTRTIKAYGIVDNNNNLVAERDVFTRQVGDDWRIPTKQQLRELMEKCEWTIVTLGGKKCWRVEGSSGKTIYFPIAGYKNNYNRLIDNNAQCAIYSATSKDFTVAAYYSVWKSNEMRIDSVSREFMFTMRGVYDKSPRMLPVLNQHVPTTTLSNTVTIGGDHIASISAVSSDPEVASVNVSGRDITTTFADFTQEGRRVTVTVTSTSATGEKSQMAYTVEQTPLFNPDYVDLGLPSGLLWASYNVGASKINDYGYSIAWGDVETRHFDGNNYSDIYTLFNGRPVAELLNYNIVSENGVSNQGVLNSAFDAANLWWNDGWRMPTKTEVQELWDNCSFTRIVIDGVYGHKITNKEGDGSAWIFIPDCGYYRGTGLRERGSNCHLWTSTCEGNGSYYWRIANGGFTMGNSGERFLGMSIRPVREAPVESVPNVGTLNDVLLDRQTTGSIAVTGSNIASIRAVASHPEQFELTVSGTTINVKVNTTRSVATNVDVFITSPEGRVINRSFNIRYRNPEGVDLVDLGLPSGLMWATCNVNALSPEENGDYFAYGEVKAKNWYNAAAYNHNGKSIVTMQAEGIIDGDNRLAADYDPATYYLGEGWRSPTAADFEELHNNCTFSIATLTSGVRVTRITSKVNNNYIDLPICGRRTDFNYEYLNTYGEYWGGSITADQRPHWVSIAGTRYYLYTTNTGENFRGRPVRAVLNPNAIFQLATPANLACTLSDGAITVTWNAVPDATSYTIYRSANDADFTPIGTSATNSFVDTAPLTGLNYYRVQANGADNSMSLVSISTLPISSLRLGAHEYVDLGLPSGLKWATYNVGANAVYEYGDYYCWGETAPKETYSTGNYTHQGKQLAQLMSEGIANEAGELLPAYDAASQNWGSAWRQPTKAEVEELFNNCTQEWITLGGVNGTRLTGPNGQSVFFPASGYRRDAALNDFTVYSNNRTAHFQWHWSFANNSHRQLRYETVGFYGITVRAVTDCATENGLRRPVNFKATTANEKITLKWDAVPGATSYDVYRSADNENFTKVGNSDTNAFVDTNPVEGTNYYRVQAFGDNGAQSVLSASSKAYTLAHDFVDLGLPSGLKWATCNLGASSPEEFGDYYIWGETEPKPDCTESYASMYTKKFDWMQGNGVLDITGNLTPKYDAATYTWGGRWRMPTAEEGRELLEKCTWERVTVDGVTLAKVTGPNGNFIYLPTAGWRYNDVPQETGTCVTYWTSTPGSDQFGNGYRIRYINNTLDVSENRRYYGYPVRPVTEIGDDSQLVTPRNVRLKAENGNILVSWENIEGAATYRVYRSTDGTDFEFIGNAATNYYVDAAPDAGFNYYRVKAVGDNYAESELSVPTYPLAPHMEYVDLGLPSGLKWAKCNVGATSPAEFGARFAWGDPIPSNGEQSPWYNTQTRHLGEVIYQSHLAPAYDPATVNWGSVWYQPTCADFVELIRNCTWTIETLDGHKGYRVTGVNGNSIFIPFVGADPAQSYTSTCYWSSTPYGESATRSYAADLREWSMTRDMRDDYRSYASPVRAVTLSIDADILRAPTDIIGIPTAENISLTWSEIEGATAYAIFRSIDADGYDLIATVTANTYVDIPAAAGTYYYRVQALGENNSRSELSLPSDAIEFKLYHSHEYVDLGLPSGIMWAKCNIGADYATDYGDVYAWGEVFTKSSNNADNNPYYGLSYADLKAQGVVDAKGILTPDHDAAITNWGGGWRMPNIADLNELLSRCTWEWEVIDGVKGYTVTGPNGNSIFMPAAGSANDSFGLHNNNGIYGYYALSNAVNNTTQANFLMFSAYDVHALYQWDRWRATSVRPVVQIPDRNTLNTPRDFAVEVTDGYISLSWEWVFGATSYKVFRSADGENFTEYAEAVNNYYVDNSPANGLNYYRVQAVGEEGLHSAVTETSEPIDYLAYNGHEYVDLGLPSGTLWATCNIGAATPYDWGDFIAWGETLPKNFYDVDNYIWPNFVFNDLMYSSKINVQGNLSPAYDAATVNWGADWHIPTRAQMEELMEYTSWEVVDTTWYRYRKVTSKINGNTMIMPMGGYKASDTRIEVNPHFFGMYQTSTAVEGQDGYIHLMRFDGDTRYMITDNNPQRGYLIRPVRN